MHGLHCAWVRGHRAFGGGREATGAGAELIAKCGDHVMAKEDSSDVDEEQQTTDTNVAHPEPNATQSNVANTKSDGDSKHSSKPS